MANKTISTQPAKEFVLRITGDVEITQSQTAVEKEVSTKNVKKAVDTSSKSNEEYEKHLRFLKAKAFQGIRMTQRVVESGINYGINLTENYILNDTINFAKTAVNKVSDFAGTVATGAKYGGPVGAIVATGLAVAKEATSIRQTLVSTQQSLNEQNYNISNARTRAGLVNGGRGTDN